MLILLIFRLTLPRYLKHKHSTTINSVDPFLTVFSSLLTIITQSNKVISEKRVYISALLISGGFTIETTVYGKNRRMLKLFRLMLTLALMLALMLMLMLTLQPEPFSWPLMRLSFHPVKSFSLTDAADALGHY